MRIHNIISSINIYKRIFLCGGLVGLLLSCSNITEDDRLIYVEPAKASRNVLIEDFTGQQCRNCPDASVAIEEIKEIYGENVIAVAIHCGPNGGVNARIPGLMTDTGKEYWSAWFSSGMGQPVAKINRGEASNTFKEWSFEVARLLEQTTDVSISATVNYDPSSKKGEMHVSTCANNGRKAMIQVWLTEDKIIAPQIMPDGKRNSEYEHNHIFRSAVNGTWGDDIIYNQDEILKTWEFAIEEEWKPENMHAVVFVYDDNGVEQVVQVPLIDPIEIEVK